MSVFRRFSGRKDSPAARRRQLRQLGMEYLEDRRLLTVAPFEARFDFGTGGSPLDLGSTQVSEATTYSVGQKFGWVNGAISSRDREVGSDLERDFNFTRDGTFAVDLPNGKYDLKLIMGDLGSYMHDNVGVFLEGVQRDTVTTPARQVNCLDYEVVVGDGQLTLRIVDLGGRDANAVIESMAIVATGPIVPVLAIGDVQRPEGDEGSQDWIFPVTLSTAATEEVTVEYATSDASATSGSDYAFATGTLRIPAGQTSGTIRVSVTGDRAIEADESFYLTLNNASVATLGRSRATGTILNDDVPPTLRLSLSPTSVSEGAGPAAVAATLTRSGSTTETLIVQLYSSDTSEATVPPTVVFASGENAVNFNVAARDDSEADGSQLVTISASATGYATGQAALVVADDDRPPFAARFDFGTGGSPVFDDFANISNGTRYSTVLGYGWAAGAIFAADRGIGSALVRDFNFTQDGTFVVDLPNGRYKVDMTLGDLGRYAHDQVGIFLENRHVDSVSTAAYQTVDRTYETEVTDGHFTLRIADQGGRDSNGVIESLEIVAAGPVVPPPPVVPILSIGDVTRNEQDSGTQDFVFPLTLSAAAASEVSVEFVTSDGTAQAGSDYAATSGTLRIPAGQTSGTIRVAVTGDESVEVDETFYVDLSNAMGATLNRNRAVGTIVTDDVPPRLSVSLSPSSISEAAGINAATGMVTRTGPTTSALTITLTSSDVSEATVPISVEIPAGQSSASFALNAIDDSDSDGSQNVTITATATNVVAGQAVVEVTDDDLPPFAEMFDFGTANSPLESGYRRVVASDRYSSTQRYGWLAGSINEYDRGVGTALTRDFNFTHDGTFVVDVPNGRYNVGMTLGDLGRYAHDNVGIVLEGLQVDSVSTAAYDVVDREYEVEVDDGQLTLRLMDLGGSDANGVIEALAIVAAGPVVPELSIADVVSDERDSGVSDFVFAVNLSIATSVEVSVHYATSDSGAHAGSDYVATSGTLRIPPGQTSGTIRVAVNGDDAIESNEDFVVTLSSVVNATMNDLQAVGTIRNDDFPPTLSVSVTPKSISENAGAGAATGTVMRSGPTTTAVTVRLTSNDPREATVPISIEIPAGSTSATFPVVAHDDTDSDGSQYVTFTAVATGYIDGQFKLEVTDDDQPPFEAFFDFGTGGSPLSPGFARVSEATSYSATLGYGWLAGAVRSTDRSAGGLVERDIVYTGDATFAVDVPNGKYWVDIILGDKANYAHDLMGVYFEGVQRASVSTGGRQLVNRSFEVDVTDGQLTLRLLDLGGGDANVVIEGLRVLAAGTENPRSDAWWPARRNISNALFSQPGKLGAYDYFTVDSAYERTENNIRVLLPDGYDPQQTYPVIYVLPVEKGNGRQFGDGMTSIYDHGLQHQYDAIFVSPTFSDTPWYADNISNQSVWQETYFRTVIVPFIEEQYSVVDGPDGRLLLGYSKSGYGAVSMLLRHPDYFGRALAWDAPLAMSDPSSGWDFLYVVGSRENFHQNYEITTLLNTHGEALKGQPPRIFLQGYSYDFTRADHATIDALMTSLDIPHVYEEGVYRSHLWASGWMPDAVDTLLSGV